MGLNSPFKDIGAKGMVGLTQVFNPKGRGNNGFLVVIIHIEHSL